VLRTMTIIRVIAAGAGILMIGLSVAAAGWVAAGEQPVQTRPEQPPVTVRVSPAIGQAKAESDARAAQRGAAQKPDDPLVKFFNIRDRARSVVYVIDCSGSMAVRNSLEVAKRELLTSLGQLPPDAQFAVIFYNLQARVLIDDQGHKGLMAASPSNQKRVQSQIAKIEPDGGTDHILALRKALALKPDVIIFLTDADLCTNSDVEEILWLMGRTPKEGAGSGPSLMAAFRSFVDGFPLTNQTQKTRIQVIQFGRGPQEVQPPPLRRLATTTGGSYMYFDVSQVPRTYRD
jgi:hypothetical protein